MLTSRTVTVTKSFYALVVCSLITYVIIGLYSLRYGYQSDIELITKWNDIKDVLDGYENELQKKYILFDTDSVLDSFIEGDQLFKDYQCLRQNCYITVNKKLLVNRDFDAVVINASEIENAYLPALRPKKQRYVFFAQNPSDHTPICRTDADNRFDYTWSYKLSSDILSPLFVVEYLNGTYVAPSHHVNWITDRNSSNADNLKFLKKKVKSKAVVMVDRRCDDDYGKVYAYKLRQAMKFYYQNLHNFKCGQKGSSEIPRAYYFVLVTSDSSEDYVTDKVLNAYLNNAVPIIRSKADLTKFLPPGSYIDARLQTVDQIAAHVHACTRRSNNRTLYKPFFWWKNYYIIRKRRDYEGICRLCSLLHSGTSSRPKRKADLRKWWNNGTSKKCGKEL